MATPRFAWGIDVGNRALKAVKLVAGAEGLMVDDFDVIEHETVLSAAGDNRETLIQTALATFVAKHPGIEKGQVGVGVTGQQSFARFIKLPPVETKKIPEIVRFEAIQQIPFPLDEVEWSYQLFTDTDSPDVEVGIFAMRKDLVNQHIKFFTDANLNVQAVQMNPLSVYNGMYYDSRIKGTTMIIDIGAENTDLIIAEGETIWLRSISIGGNNFTESLSKAFKVDFAKGEDLKRNASTSKYGRQIMQAMRPIFADLVSEIQRSIGFYSSVHKESRISKVIAVGSTFRLPGLQKYLSQNLTLDVEKLDRLGSGAFEDPKLAATFSDNLLSAAGAYGLALQVMGQGKIASSLLPEHIRREKKWKEKTRWFMAAAAMFVVGAAIPYGRYSLDNSEMNSGEATDANQKISTLKITASKLDNEWSTIEASGATDRQQTLNVLSLATGRNLWPQINTLIVQSLPQFAADAPKDLQSEDINDIKKIPRAKRNQIIITGMVAKYSSDLSSVLQPGFSMDSLADVAGLTNVPGSNASSDMGMGRIDLGMGMAAPTMDAMGNPVPGSKPIRGFILTLNMTTPNESGVSLIDKFNETLKTNVATPDRPLEVEVTHIAHQMVLRDDKQRLVEIGNAFVAAQRAKEQATREGLSGISGGNLPGGGGGFMPGQDMRGGGGFGGSFGGGGLNLPPGLTNTSDNKIPDEAYLDPVLHEDIRSDTECTVVLVVVLDPAPKPKVAKTLAMAQPGQP